MILNGEIYTNFSGPNVTHFRTLVDEINELEYWVDEISRNTLKIVKEANWKLTNLIY